MQRTDHEEHQTENHPAPDGIMLRNEVSQQPEHRCIDQREQPADEPEADAGICPKNSPITEQTSPMKSPVAIIAPCAASQPIKKPPFVYTMIASIIV